MKPIENIFGFDCVTCEHNRHCYGGNMGNQFRYCQKSTEKIQNLDNLEQENKQLRDNIRQMDNSIDKLQKQLIKEKDNWNKLKEIIKKEQDYYMYYKDNRYRGFLYKLSEKMQEIEKERNSNVKD